MRVERKVLPPMRPQEQSSSITFSYVDVGFLVPDASTSNTTYRTAQGDSQEQVKISWIPGLRGPARYLPPKPEQTSQKRDHKNQRHSTAAIASF